MTCKKKGLEKKKKKDLSIHPVGKIAKKTV